ncbi:2,4-diaminopentanoate dehydrogenase [Halioglobus japonicus]|nr:2,4-diaminopentanoate dehydrogenase [Halioglobus japonicus]
MKYKVIQWATGHVGMPALQGIINRDYLELVGLMVSDPGKVGVDAGRLVGGPDVGILATSDREQILAMEADVVCYTAASDFRPQECLSDMCDILRSGKNLVTSSMVTLVNPYEFIPDVAAMIESACQEGGSSFLCAGIDPGFAPDALPIMLSAMSDNIQTIRQQTIWGYDSYDQPETLEMFMGFGKPIGSDVPLLTPGAISMTWGPSARMIAEALGVELDEVRQRHEQAPAPETFEIPTGTIEKGMAAGLRFEVIGVVNGEERIVLEHVARLREDVAPDWPQGNGPGTYRITVEGSPNFRCELDFGLNGEDHNIGAMKAAAMCCVNAIPRLVSSEPGFKRWLDFSSIAGRGALS